MHDSIVLLILAKNNLPSLYFDLHMPTLDYSLCKAHMYHISLKRRIRPDFQLEKNWRLLNRKWISGETFSSAYAFELMWHLQVEIWICASEPDIRVLKMFIFGVAYPLKLETFAPLGIQCRNSILLSVDVN